MKGLIAFRLVLLVSGLLRARTAVGKSLYRKPHKVTEADYKNHTFSLWKAKSREHQLKHSTRHSGGGHDDSVAHSAAEDGESSTPHVTRGWPSPASSSEASSLLATRAKARAHSERLRAATASNRTGHQIVLRADNTPTSALRAAVNQRHNRQWAGRTGSSSLHAKRSSSSLDASQQEAVPPPQPLAELSKHSLVFVGGMPQSGTSLARELLLTPSSSGMDSCMKSTRCSLTNVEGQWLLGDDSDHKGRLRAIYGAGDIVANHHLTEHNHTTSEHADMREFLWRSWSPFWDIQRPVLVEKSPPNFLKVRWLAEVFSPAKQVKFVLVVKDPIANAHFERPQKCWDVTSVPCRDYFSALAAAPAAATAATHSRGNGDSAAAAAPSMKATSRLPLVTSSAPPKQCAASHALCQGQRGHRLWARYMYARQWVEDHERLVRDLQSWGPKTTAKMQDQREEEETYESREESNARAAAAAAAAASRRRELEAIVSSDVTDDALKSPKRSINRAFSGQNRIDYVDINDVGYSGVSSQRRSLLSRKSSAATAAAGVNGTRAVLVVRYEQFADGCTCEAMLRFAFSEYAPSQQRAQGEEGGSHGRMSSSSSYKRQHGPPLIPESDIAAACQRAPTCSTKGIVKPRSTVRYGPKSSSRDSRDKSSRDGRTSISSIPATGASSSSSGSEDNDVTSIEESRPMGSGSSTDGSTLIEGCSREPLSDGIEQQQEQQQESRRLGYEGNGGGGKPATVHKDKSSAPRHAFWQQQLDLIKGWPEGCLDAFKALEPRARALGYSLLEPGVHTYDRPGDERTDAFAPWALSDDQL